MKIPHLGKVISFLSVLFAMTGCSKEPSKSIDVSHIKIDMKVDRLESELFACITEEQVLDFLEKHPALYSVYFPDLNGPQKELAAQLFRNISNPGLVDFKQQLDSIFTDFDQSVAEPLREAYRHIKYYYPEASVPNIKTMVTGFLGSDLFVSDTLILIGLDYFGGPAARFRPDVYNYQLPRYDRHYLAPSVMFFEAQRYNRLNPDDITLLADMVWYGKNYAFVKHMLPGTPDSLVLGFSQQNLVKAEVSQLDIWAHFTSNKLLYEHLEQKKQKYVGERPFTYEIGEDVPGGIGRWVGWKIVDHYIRTHPEETLQQVMDNDNARAILEASGYKGQRD